jgi:hypothetical protein
MWLNSGVTTARVEALAASLDIGLGSPGVCVACLSLVAPELERGDKRAAAGRLAMVASSLWAEGLGEVGLRAAELEARSGDEDATDALRDLESRSFRSEIFRAVVRRLAGELAGDMRRAHLASLN